jgi:hypothetical protein
MATTVSSINQGLGKGMGSVPRKDREEVVEEKK